MDGMIATVIDAQGTRHNFIAATGVSPQFTIRPSGEYVEVVIEMNGRFFIVGLFYHPISAELVESLPT